MSNADSASDLAASLTNPQKLPFRGPADIRDGKNLYLVNEGGVDFDFYLHCKTERANRLHVVLPGAANRRLGHLTYARHSWSDRFTNSHFASFCDPTIKAENDLWLGWFQYSTSSDCQAALAQSIARLSKSLAVPSANVTILGSSGGGFAALQMHKYLPHARLIAINPQTDISKHHNPRRVDAILNACYPGETKESAVAKYRSRMVVEPKLVGRKAPIFILQNIYDPNQLNGHVLPMLEGLESSDFQILNVEQEPLTKAKPLNVVLYEDANAKHSPPGINTYLRFFNTVLRLPPMETPSLR